MLTCPVFFPLKWGLKFFLPELAWSYDLPNVSILHSFRWQSCLWKVKLLIEKDSCELFSQACLESGTSWFQALKKLGWQVWATSTRFVFSWLLPFWLGWEKSQCHFYLYFLYSYGFWTFLHVFICYLYFFWELSAKFTCPLAYSFFWCLIFQALYILCIWILCPIESFSPIR
jgi:hypothetical protein